MFQNDFQKWTSKFWVIRSNSAPLSSGSIAYLPEVKKELAATPAEGEEALHSKMSSVFVPNNLQTKLRYGKKKIELQKEETIQQKHLGHINNIRGTSKWESKTRNNKKEKKSGREENTALKTQQTSEEWQLTTVNYILAAIKMCLLPHAVTAEWLKRNISAGVHPSHCTSSQGWEAERKATQAATQFQSN